MPRGRSLTGTLPFTRSILLSVVNGHATRSGLTVSLGNVLQDLFFGGQIGDRAPQLCIFRVASS